jgi:hypothetical protein
MTTEQRIEQMEKKIDIVLNILGHGRTKSDAEIERAAGADLKRLRLMSEQRKRKKEPNHGKT